MAVWIAALNKPDPAWPRLVRDIYWSVASQPLVLDPQDARFPRPDWFTQEAKLLHPALNQLANDSAALKALEEQATPLRLGGYFEALLSWWIEHSNRYELLSHNQQIHIDGITAGAFDFIVRDTADGSIEHWEVACKFYIRDGVGDQLEHWFGPARNDRFDRKFGHLLNHQIALSENAGKTWLTAQGWAIDRQRIIIKGRLYADFENNPTIPDICNPALLKGWVSTQENWQQPTHMALQRHHWLSPILPDDINHHDASKALRHGCLCSALLESNSEISRGFVIPNDWYQQQVALRR